jgi:thioredoxin reductase (NADPH)
MDGSEAGVAKPVLMAIDDDPEVLRAVSRDLKRRYGDRYRVLDAASGGAGLELVAELERRQEPLALLVADQRMPAMSGTEFLAEAGARYPEAKRVLLTAYADTDAAIEAINRAHIEHYLLKPWHPPEEKLYPVLDEILADWQAAFKPAFQGVRLIDAKWSPAAHLLKGFLARNQVPYVWLDAERHAEARRAIEAAGAGPDDLPMVVCPDGSTLLRATPALVAEKVGLRTRAESAYYDLVIAGGGPAGLAAAVYGGSEGLQTLLVEREAPGGQAGESSLIENYLGFPSGVSGSELAQRAAAQARRFGVQMLVPQEVAALEVDGPYRRLRFADGSAVSCHALIVATGVSYRRLEMPGATELAGAGVYYGAAAAEVAALRGQDVVVVGGGNSAGQAAMHLSRFARSVTVVVRAADLNASMSRYLIDRLAETANVSVRFGTRPTALVGNGHLERIDLAVEGSRVSLPAAAVFVFIGAKPRTDWLGDHVRRDAQGYLLTGADLVGDDGKVAHWPLTREPYPLETSLPGVFAAGDVRYGSVKRVASGVGEGAMAVSLVHRYLATL